MLEKTASTAAFSVGNLVLIEGLQEAPQWNGRIGVVLKYHESNSRYEICTGRGRKTVGVKASNLNQNGLLRPEDPEFYQAREFDNLFIWPQAKLGEDGERVLPVQGFSELPVISGTDCRAQDEYLRNLLKWESVDHVGGVEEPGRDLATFMSLFDKTDRKGSFYHVAQAILVLLPEYQKKNHKDLKLRGVCVLTYSPTKTTFVNSSGFQSQPMMEANVDRKFTHQQLYNIVTFHSTEAARKQYRDHDDPLHRTCPVKYM